MTDIRLAWPHVAAPLGDDAILDLYDTGPGLRANFVSSLDGAATLDGRSGGLSGEADKRVFSLLRRLADVVLVGAGTVRAEGYQGELVDAASRAWRVAHGRAPHPALAIVSGSLELDAGSELFTRSPVRPTVFTTAHAPHERREALSAVADIVVCGTDTLDAHGLRAALGDVRVLCEGGPHLFATLLAADVVDELCLTVAPSLAGGESIRIAEGQEQLPRGMGLGHALVSDDWLLLRYVRALEL
jgi:riboflavin biosynthesis pyrimidine reductase